MSNVEWTDRQNNGRSLFAESQAYASGVGIYLLIKAITFDYWIIGSLIVGGVMLLFSETNLLSNWKR